MSYCVCRIILCLFHEPISDNCAVIAVRNCFSPGRECHQTSNFLLQPGNHFARGGSPVMMASINPNKTPHKVISEVCSYFNDKCPFCQFFLPYPGLVRQHLRGRWLQLEGKETMRKCLRGEVSQVRRHEELLPITSLLYIGQRGDLLQHGQMRVSATPAGTVQVAKKVSQHPEGDSPDKGAEQCWRASQQSKGEQISGSNVSCRSLSIQVASDMRATNTRKL